MGGVATRSLRRAKPTVKGIIRKQGGCCETKNINNQTSETKVKAEVKGHEQVSNDFVNKTRFSLWLKQQTMAEVEEWYLKDNCRSKSEFIELAILFYIGYLERSSNINYLAPIITDSVNGIVLGSERRMNRNLFKIAVELGKLSHMIAAVNDIDEDTLNNLHAMCVNEVRHINGTIDFESAVEYQKE